MTHQKITKEYKNLIYFSFNRIISIFVFIFSIKIVINEEVCTSEQPYKKSNICVTSCSQDDIFNYKTCIPISSNEEDIKNMLEKIKAYIQTINNIQNEIIISGEGINYQITTNNLISQETNTDNSINLKIGEECISKIKEGVNNEDFYIILINIINNNYTTSFDGFKIIAFDTEFSIKILCGGNTLSFEIPVSIPNETLTQYNKLNDEYNYDILNLNNSFYTDICELYTTEDNTDMSLSKRIEIFGSHEINPCAENCKYIQFNINTTKIKCECYIETGEEGDGGSNLGQQIYDKLAEFLDLINFDVMLCFKLFYSIEAKNIVKNYGFMIITISAFIFIICMIISFSIIRRTVIKIVNGFNYLRKKLKNMVQEEMNKNDNNDNNDNNNNEKENENNNIDNGNNNLKLAQNNNNEIQKNKGEEKGDEEDEEEEEDYEEGEEEEDELEDNEKKQKKEERKPKEENNIKNDDKAYDKEIKENKKEDENKYKFEEPKKINEYDERKNITPRSYNNNNNNNNNPPQFYYDYNQYYNYYYNYMNYMQQYYNNIYNNYNNNFNNNNNNNFNDNQSEQQNINRDISHSNDSNQPNKNNIVKLIIPYEKIKERIKLKGKTEINKPIKKLRDRKTKKTKKQNNLINDEEKKTRKKSKKKSRRYKEKSKTNRHEKQPREFEINLEDVLKPNPPKRQTVNINNNTLMSSGKAELNLNSIIDSKKDDYSEYSISENENKNKNKQQNSNKNIEVYNKIENNEININNQMDNTKIRENDDKASESSNHESDIKFGSEEFYQMLMKLPKEKRAEFFIGEELNSLDYQYAVEIDTRSYCELYISLLKRQNVIMFSLSYCGEDFNMSILKLSLLIFQFILFIVVSAFFFTDNTLNNVYENKNKFDVPFMIRQLGLTFIICYGVNILLKILMRTDNRIIDIKEENEKLFEGISSIKCKMIFYFIITMIIIIFGWFYITCFCVIYSHTQIILLKCAAYSLAVTFVYPFFLCLVPPLFRICALKAEKKDKKCLYEFSKIISYL